MTPGMPAGPGGLTGKARQHFITAIAIEIDQPDFRAFATLDSLRQLGRRFRDEWNLIPT